MGPEQAAGGSGQVACPPPPGMHQHLPTLPNTRVTRLTLQTQTLVLSSHLLEGTHRLRIPERIAHGRVKGVTLS